MQRPEGLQPSQPQVSPPSAHKAAYERPTLVEYGSVRALTQNQGGHGPFDGGMLGRTRLRSQL